jgi:ubiquinone/menaquinone biosynthesis C-methylase UbiE
MAAADPDRSTAFTADSVPDHYERHLAPAIFEPWAEILLDAAGIELGSRVLDVASGTGVVARAAARRVGPRGRVVASDVSPAMLTRSAASGSPAGAAPIDYVEASATDLPFADGSFDVAVCQQGLQFFPDRGRAVRELCRVLRPGGVAGLSVWADTHRLEPFGHFSDALAAAGVAPPFPGAFDNASYVMGEGEVRALFSDAGFSPILVSVVEQDVSWPEARGAIAGILGTPFGPAAAGLSPQRREQLDADLMQRLEAIAPGAPVRRTTAAIVARAVAPTG